MMKFYAPISKVDAEQRMVWGYASTTAEDADGETITIGALQGAVDDYMKFGNVRQMHALSAVGKTKEATVDDKGMYVAVKIVDDDAWNKVVEGVYSGFSVGGRATARDPANRRTIVGLQLSEISLVDRPCNPEAVFDCWKAAGAGSRQGADDELGGFVLNGLAMENPDCFGDAIRDAKAVAAAFKKALSNPQHGRSALKFATHTGAIEC